MNAQQVINLYNRQKPIIKWESSREIIAGLITAKDENGVYLVTSGGIDGRLHLLGHEIIAKPGCSLRLVIEMPNNQTASEDSEDTTTKG